MDALAIGLSTQRALAQSVDTIAYNLANASTTGFRATAERFERKSRMADGVPVDMVQSQAGALERASGSLTKTDNPLDVAVSQDRWLGVQTQAGVGYTKDGRLKIAESGMLMTSMDLPVVDESGAPIMVNPAGGPLLIRQNGVVLQDGAEAGRIGLFSLPPEANLQRLSPLVVWTESPADAGGEGREASLQQGFLETSNVNPMAELTKLITAQRFFSGTTTLIEACEASFNDAIKTLSATG